MDSITRDIHFEILANRWEDSFHGFARRPVYFFKHNGMWTVMHELWPLGMIFRSFSWDDSKAHLHREEYLVSAVKSGSMYLSRSWIGYAEWLGDETLIRVMSAGPDRHFDIDRDLRPSALVWEAERIRAQKELLDQK